MTHDDRPTEMDAIVHDTYGSAAVLKPIRCSRCGTVMRPTIGRRTVWEAEKRPMGNRRPAHLTGAECLRELSNTPEEFVRLIGLSGGSDE
jgi:hypothetical protein